MRRLPAALFVLLLTVSAIPAAAQDDPAPPVELRLLEQTAWNGPQRGQRVLTVRVRAQNDGEEDLGRLTLAMTIFAPARGRLEYEESLSGDATAEIDTDPREQPGPLPAGGSREFEVVKTLNELIDRGDTAVYPMKLELRSDDVPVATIRSPIVFVVPEEEVEPLRVSTTIVLADRLHQDPAGRFLDRSLEAAVGPDGWLAGVVNALRDDDDLVATLAISPLLLRQLAEMRDGYEVTGEGGGAVGQGARGAADAARSLTELSALVAQGEPDLATYPFAGPSLPALAAGGLDRDIRNQLLRGAALVERLVGRAPDPSLIRPPLGHLDGESLGELEALSEGKRPTVLLDSGSAVPPEDAEGLGFSPAASGRAQAGDVELPAILASASLQSVLETVPDDPVLRAQAALGELAVIHQERPGVLRGVAVVLGESRRPQAAFVRAFLAGLRSVPLLQARRAGEFLTELRTDAEFPLADRSSPQFTADYEADIRQTRDQIERFRSVFLEAADLSSTMGELVLLAEAQQFIRDEEAGRGFLRRVQGIAEGRFAKITTVGTEQPVTLASRSGPVPVSIRNDGGGTAAIRVHLLSPSLRFQGGDVRDITVEPGVTTFPFVAQTRRGGRFPVQLVLCPPDTAPQDCEPGDRAAISDATIIVRSTVYNRVALVLTIGAAVFLLAGWGRRVIRRART